MTIGDKQQVSVDGQECLFLRLLAHDDKAAALSQTVAALRDGRAANPVAFAVDPASFAQVPGSPFAYWVSERVHRLFRTLPPFDNEAAGRSTRCGIGTTDNFRFLRLNWEVPIAGKNGDWLPYYDGGVYSPVYDLFPLTVWWKDDGQEIKSFIASKFGSASRKVQAEEYYMKPGFVFPRRTKGLCPKIMPAGGIFSNAGQAGFAPKGELLPTIGLLTSEVCTLLVSLSQGRTGDAAQFEVGLIKRLPWLEVKEGNVAERLASLTRAICDAKRTAFQGNELAPEFVAPHILRGECSNLHKRIRGLHAEMSESSEGIDERLSQINALASEAYGIDPQDRHCRASYVDLKPHLDADTEDAPSGPAALGNAEGLVADMVSYATGSIFGRWDTRFATGRKEMPELSDPFAPLPICSPGMLQGPDGLPAKPKDVPDDYPLRIDWDGILVDDPEHQDDIVRRVRDVLEVIWKDRAETIEKEACEILGAKSLRDYFRRPGKGGFWDDHVRRYSKSRRKAPIYWLLQSSKKNYALWLYYHRLDKDMLFKALVNYVEPKIRLEEGRLDSLRSQKGAAEESGKGAKKLDREVEKQEDFLSELRDFEDKLRRAAGLHLVPDLNDGVVLNIAPLHELVPWKEAKNYWQELLEGKYEWSSIGKQLRERSLVRGS